ncbi:hypothetical protein Trydic_g3227 [Trypoxylus dichotomus]
MRNLMNCLILVHVRHLENCLQHWMLIDPPLENAYMPWEWFRRHGIGYHTSYRKGTLKGIWLRAKCWDKKWIHYANPKCKLAWVELGEPAKRNIRGLKVMRCISWDMRGVIYYELLKSFETIYSQRYRLQLMRLKQGIEEKRLE